ncbi:Bax inhibitor-1/YccA family protein [Maritalea mediterranea]|uniref:Bax inhibitor-1/YccA family protein n=1 Tax=Maritalea mediterranea TaxID=2909667 RepID=A0ABS9E1X7_9HYPH|nr:Bax inhibitor-1/YccA family protein [Maritalea mediterranea]MCF4096866.1 Bax inhibitor-1/YccA family protein [Maritalea mediterranea]
MAQYDRQTMASRGGAQAAIDEGLRTYMLGVYNYMGIALGITGVVAYFISMFAATSDPANAVGTLGNGVMLTQLGATLYGSPLQWVVMLAPLAFVFALSFGIHKMQFATAQLVFWGFSVAMGLSLSSIFLVYTGESIARVFFITAGTFGAMSLYGYTTKRDLTAWGSFLMMGLIGIILASVVNIFLQSGALAFAISIIGVLVFVGLTAYDTQKIKENYYEGDGSETMGKKMLMGALALYLDFINLFLMLLRLFGNRE